jgi:hypothetical protein
MEILDNMPHDRLYKSNHSTTFDSQAEIIIKYDENGKETSLEEVKTPISDRLVKEFLKHYETMLPADHIKAT